MGTDDLLSKKKRQKVVDIFIHKEYVPEQKTDVCDTYSPPQNDIALLRLNSAGDGEEINPVQADEEFKFVAPGNPVTLAGWGLTTENGFATNDLMQVDLNIFRQEAGVGCNAPDSYDGKVTNTMFCSGSRGHVFQGFCDGDSGGPVVQKGRLVGLMSWSCGCRAAYWYGVHTNVAKYSTWISACIKDPKTCRL